MAAPTPTTLVVLKSSFAHSPTLGNRVNLTLGWTTTSGSASYSIGYRIHGSVSGYTTLGVAAIAATSFSYSGDRLYPAAQYDFHIVPIVGGTAGTALDGTFTMPAIATAGTLATPTGLAVPGGSLGTTTAKITWNDDVPNETSYLVEYRRTGIDELIPAPVPAAATSVTLSHLLNATGYDVRVSARSFDTDGAQIVGAASAWVSFTTASVNITTSLPDSVQLGEQILIFFSTPSSADWTLSGMTSGIELTTGGLTASGMVSVGITGQKSAVGDYPLTITAVGGWGTSSLSFLLRVVSRPVIATDYPYYTSAANTFTVPINKSVDVQLYANYGADFWSAVGLPDGFALDPITGRLTGSSFTPRTFPFTVTAANANGTSDPVSFFMVITAVEGGSRKAPYLAWLHSDPLNVDVQWDVRTGELRSYYMETDAIHIKRGDGLKLCVVPYDGETRIEALDDLVATIASVDEYDGDPLLEFLSFTPTTVAGGGTYFLASESVTSDRLNQKFRALNLPAGANNGSASLAAILELEGVFSGTARSSKLASVVIEQDLNS